MSIGAHEVAVVSAQGGSSARATCSRPNQSTCTYYLGQIYYEILRERNFPVNEEPTAFAWPRPGGRPQSEKVSPSCNLAAAFVHQKHFCVTGRTLFFWLPMISTLTRRTSSGKRRRKSKGHYESHKMQHPRDLVCKKSFAPTSGGEPC